MIKKIYALKSATILFAAFFSFSAPVIFAQDNKQASSTQTESKENKNAIINYTVKSGDTLRSILLSNNISKNEIYTIMYKTQNNSRIKNIKIDQKIIIEKNSNNQLLTFILKLDPIKIIEMKKDQSGFNIIEKEYNHKVITSQAIGTVRSYFYTDAKRAGISDKAIIGIKDIFSSKINLDNVLEKGTKFSVIYEDIYVDNIKVDTGRILAAQFNVKGRTLNAFRYEIDGIVSYYNESGENLKKGFISNPLTEVKITSEFTSKRYHPILGKIKEHKGIDFSAPKNTPIHVTADGIVKFIGRKGGYGNMVEIQHGNKYSTLYAHMNKFSDLKVGDKVSQNQVIGYVGQTGYATGPHLHYEFKINETQQNPLTVALPSSGPLDINEIATFTKVRNQYLANFNTNLPDSIRVIASNTDISQEGY